jgi:hypothetical protein
MWDPSSRESPEPKLALKDLFNSRFGLTKFCAIMPALANGNSSRKLERAFLKM